MSTPNPGNDEPSLRAAAESRGWTVSAWGESAGNGRKAVISPEGVAMLCTAGELWDELARRDSPRLAEILTEDSGVLDLPLPQD